MRKHKAKYKRLSFWLKEKSLIRDTSGGGNKVCGSAFCGSKEKRLKLLEEMKAES